jgi:hypothetical protein
VDVVGDWKHLQSSTFHRRKKVIDVLSAHDLFDGEFLVSTRPAFEDVTSLVVEFRLVARLADNDLGRLGRQVRSAKLGRVWLHGQPVKRFGPELVEVLVAVAAGLGAHKLGTIGLIRRYLLRRGRR